MSYPEELDPKIKSVLSQLTDSRFSQEIPRERLIEIIDRLCLAIENVPWIWTGSEPKEIIIDRLGQWWGFYGQPSLKEGREIA